MKISVSMIVWREEELVRESLLSVVDAVDHVNVIEGRIGVCYPEHIVNGVDRGGPDHTGDIIHDVMKDHPEVEFQYQFLDKPVDNHAALRSRSYNSLPKDTDFVLVLDGDSFYDEDEIFTLHNLITRYPNIDGVYTRHYLFFRHPKQVLEVAPEHIMVGYQIPWAFYKYYKTEGYYGEAVIGPNVSKKPWMYTETGEQIPRVSIAELPQHVNDERIALLDLKNPIHRLWHWGFARSGERLKEKMVVWARAKCWGLSKMSEGEIQEGGFMPFWAAMREVYWSGDHEKFEKVALGWCRLYHHLWTGILDKRFGTKIVPYSDIDGYYPPVLANHPYLSMSEEELLGEDFYD